MSVRRVPADNGKAMAWGLAYTLAGLWAILLGWMSLSVEGFSAIAGIVGYAPALIGANWFAKKIRKIEYESNN